MHALVVRAKRFYVAHPLQLLALLACFALAGYAALRTAAEPDWPVILVWFLAAVVAHDLIVFPLYALADRSLTVLSRRLPAHRPLVSPLNYVRVPALGAALTLALFLPGIIRQGTATYLAATGQTQQPFLGRWLLLCAAMFGASAIVYAVRLRVASAPARAAVAEVRARLRPGERVLTFARDATGTAGAVATTHALYYQHNGWQRRDWADIDALTWRPTDGMLTATGFSGLPGSTLKIPLADPHDLPATAQRRITATLTGTTPIEPTGQRLALLTVRRRASGELVWRVDAEPGADPHDPHVQAEVDAALTAMRSDLDQPAT